MKTYFKIFVVLALAGQIISCNQSKDNTTEPTQKEVKVEKAVKNGMVKVSVLYPNGEDKTFDMDYYINTHMKMVVELAGDSLKAMSVEKGFAGAAPDVPVPYLAIGNMYFEKMSAFQNSMGPHTDQLMADIPNFTNSEPVIQISLVQLAE